MRVGPDLKGKFLRIAGFAGIFVGTQWEKLGKISGTRPAGTSKGLQIGPAG